LNEYRKQGYLPEAVFNFLALLGFTPPEGKEILSQNDLMEIFELSKIHKSGAVFDIKKLDWMNKEYMKKMSDAEFLEYISKYLEDGAVDKDYLYRVLPLVRERIKRFDEISEFKFFFEDPQYEKDLLIWKNKPVEEIKNSLLEVKKIVEKGIEDEAQLRLELDELGKNIADRGLVYWPFRVALSGQKNSPDPVQISLILGKQKTLSRVESAIGKL
jgi:glutamyl/glutaminyl-tRNA synthetase